MKVKFIGWYGRGNCGDEAFKEVHRQIFPEDELEWVCDRMAEETQDSRFVLGAGDVFLDYYLQSIPANADFWVYGVGLGGERGFDRILRHKDRIRGIWLRNVKDVAVLNGLGMAAEYTPDIVFNLHDTIRDWEKPAPRKAKQVVVILSNNLYQDAQRQNSIRVVSYLDYFKHELAMGLNGLAKYYDVLLVPFSTDPNDFDPGICAEVFSLMTKFTRAETGEPAVQMRRDAPTPIEALRLMCGANLVISMKFHGLIFSTLLGIPFVNIGLSRKNQMFCADNGLEHLTIEDYSFTRARLETRVKAAEAPRTRPQIAELGAVLGSQAAAAAVAFRRSVLT